MQFPPGYSVRDAEPTEFGTYFEEHRRTMFPDTIDVDPMATLPEHYREARRDRITHRASEYRLRWFILHEQAVVGWTWGLAFDPDTFYMANTAIAEEHRRKGVYRAVLDALVARVSADGFSVITSRHTATNNAVIIPKLKAGFFITGMEISDRFGTLVTLTRYLDPAREELLRHRTGERRSSRL